MGFTTKKQKIATRESTEAELVALSDMMLIGEWLHDFLVGQGLKLKKPVIYQDNKSTISLVTKSDGGKMRTKHMRARRAAVLNDVVENKLFEVVYVNTKDMLADVLTKPLGGSQFERLMSYLMGTADPVHYSVVMHTSRTGVRWQNVYAEDVRTSVVEDDDDGCLGTNGHQNLNVRHVGLVARW